MDGLRYTAKLIGKTGAELLTQECSLLIDAIRWFRELEQKPLSVSADHVGIFANGKLIWRRDLTELRERALKENARRILMQIAPQDDKSD